jgi:predicted metal-dependent phosphoesterase TrpH
MRCDLHVHTVHSGKCAIPLLKKFCRESYNDPREAYEILKRRGMNLVTVTDHDSIGAAETLKKHSDFFLSEEVSCVTPDGARLHVGVYDIQERDHFELQRRRDDLLSLIFYLQERRLMFSVNHVFSALTGRRTTSDFVLFEHYFPLLETRNGQMSAASNLAAARLAKHWNKSAIAGSDAHSRLGLGRTYTAVPGARSKAEFLEQLRCRAGLAEGDNGGYWKLTRTVIEIASGLLREEPWALCLAPLLLLVPAVTLGNCLIEAGFHRRWSKRALSASAADRRSGIELEVGQVRPQVSSRALDEYQ